MGLVSAGPLVWRGRASPPPLARCCEGRSRSRRVCPAVGPQAAGCSSPGRPTRSQGRASFGSSKGDTRKVAHRVGVVRRRGNRSPVRSSLLQVMVWPLPFSIPINGESEGAPAFPPQSRETALCSLPAPRCSARVQ